MSLKIRLARGGAKKRPYYRIVVADVNAPRDGRFVEKVGTYNPMLPKDSNERVRLVEDRIKHWISVGAKPTERVTRFLVAAGILDAYKPTEKTKKNQPKAKAQERMKQAEEARLAAEEAAKEAAAAAEAEKAAPAEPEAEKEAPAEE